MTWLDFGLSVLSIPALAASGYLALLAILARRRPPVDSASRTRFVVLVPAHNEEAGISSTVESLRRVVYPPDRLRVIVIADNCTDHTAERAAAAGADVLVRKDEVKRGKGYALAFAFDQVLAQDFADAVVVIDADTVASPNLLSAFSARFERGAAVVQAEYSVRNALASWRTRLMTIALAAFHEVRSLARERMRVSCGLRGNGMGFSRGALQQVPPAAFSIVEDLEYGVQLGLAGIRVEYVPEAQVLGEMVTSERASRSQRHRWEHGRTLVARQHLARVAVEAFRRRDRCLADLAFDLAVPPLAQLVAVHAVGVSLAVALFAASVHAPLALWLWLASSLAIVAYVGRGWALSGVGARGMLDLMWAPVYVAWKLTLLFRREERKSDEWIRTRREVIR